MQMEEPVHNIIRFCDFNDIRFEKLSVCSKYWTNWFKKCPIWFSRPKEGASSLSLREKYYLLLYCIVNHSVMSNSLWPTDCSPPGSCVHGILQTRILEWATIPFSKGSSQSRDQTQVSCIAGRFFTIWATGKSHWTFILKICLGTFSSNSQPTVCLYCLSC